MPGFTLSKFSLNDNVIYECLLNKDLSQVFFCEVYQQINTILCCKTCFSGYSPRPVQPPSLATNVQ